MYIDTHCHLQFNNFDDDIKSVIGNAKKANIKKFIIPGVDLNSSQKALNLSINNNSLFCSLGIHPYEANKNPDIGTFSNFVKNTFAKYNQKLVAIGECGLDYHLYKGEVAAGKKDAQKYLLQSQIDLSLKYNLPLIVHVRDAFEEIYNLFDSNDKLPKIVIHCFSGGLYDLRQAIKRNYLLGFDGNITFSNNLDEVLYNTPLENILLETDSPYLTPVPFRGNRNEPKYIPLIAKKISDVKKIEIKKIELQTTKNAENFFNKL